MSSTYVVTDEGRVVPSVVADVPLFITLPGAYITALPPSTAPGSMVVHCCVATSRMRVGASRSLAPAISTLPFGSTKLYAYQGNARRAAVSCVHEFVAGL